MSVDGREAPDFVLPLGHHAWAHRGPSEALVPGHVLPLAGLEALVVASDAVA